MPIMFRSILLLMFSSCIFIGLDNPAQWNTIFGFNFVKYFSIEFKLRIFKSFLFKNFRFNFLFSFFKIFANLPLPPVTNIYGFNLNMSYKNFSVRALFNGTEGNDIVNGNMYRFGFAEGTYRNILSEAWSYRC